MPAYPTNIQEKQVISLVARDFFSEYDTTNFLGNVDFSVATNVRGNDLGLLFETEYLFWAEAKRSNTHDIYESLIQLILTIGKEKTIHKFLPPRFLGAFDAEKIAFLPYQEIADIFTQTDFNWNVTPSNHATKEFHQLLERLKSFDGKTLFLFNFANDEKTLRQFIRKNFASNQKITNKITISKNNFVAIFNKWMDSVKPTIECNWDELKQDGIFPADFYLADVLAKENQTIGESLKILLRNNYYKLAEKFAGTRRMFSEVMFNDNQTAHRVFWNLFERPPRDDVQKYLKDRRDLLVPATTREFKGEFFTPSQWVDLSQQYLARVLGENWQDEYFIWDCAAGTGNLLHGLVNKYNIFASTLNDADVQILREHKNLLDKHVFQFDFLNDDFDSEKVPESLKAILRSRESREKLVIYINPPYVEAGNKKQISGTGENRDGAARGNATFERYKNVVGKALNEIFAQFLIRIDQELTGCKIGNFSKIKTLMGTNFIDFRNVFDAKLQSLFLIPANTFDNVTGTFPIGFHIWDTASRERFSEIEADVFERNGEFAGTKKIFTDGNAISLSRWIASFETNPENYMACMNPGKSDFQHNSQNYIANELTRERTHETVIHITPQNLVPACVFLAVRHCMPATWLNDRDQFLFPRDSWEQDFEFQADCLAFTFFHGQNRISAFAGTNHWIPWREQEIAARERFASHFMSDFLAGTPSQSHAQNHAQGGETFLSRQSKSTIQLNLKMEGQECPSSLRVENSSVVWHELFSVPALAVLAAARELFRYYHAHCVPARYNANASFYDIRASFQGTNPRTGKMNADSPDARYTALLADLRSRQRVLAEKIAAKVYEHGFLK